MDKKETKDNIPTTIAAIMRSSATYKEISSARTKYRDMKINSSTGKISRFKFIIALPNDFATGKLSNFERMYALIGSLTTLPAGTIFPENSPTDVAKNKLVKEISLFFILS